MKRMIHIIVLTTLVTSMFATVAVTGRVVGNETPDVGIEGAGVVLNGDNYYVTLTDEDGCFAIFDVIGNSDYDVMVVAVGYDQYESEIYIGESDIDLGTIALFLEALVPVNLIATQTTDHEDIILSWNYANYQEYDFRYDDGEITGQLGWPAGGDDVRFGAAHYYDAVLYEISWYLTDEGAPHDQVDIYIYGLDENGIPNANDVLFETTGVENQDMFWNTYVLDVPVLAPEGFFVGLCYPEGFLGIGTDDGNYAPYEYIEGTQWLTLDASENDWHTPGEYGYEYNLAIRAMGENNGAIYYPLRGNQPARKSTAEAPVYIDGYQMPQYARERTRETYQMTFYQFYVEDANNPSQWTIIHEGEFTNADSTYVIEGFGTCIYPVQWALHYESSSGATGTLLSNAIVCPPATIPVTINVSTNSDDSPQGALVQLENNNGDEDFYYEAIVYQNNPVYFPSVMPGLYSLTVTRFDFDDYIEQNVVIENEDGEEFDVVLIESLWPVTEGYGVVDGQDILLFWNAPEPPPETLFEDFEGFGMPQDWIVLDEDNDGNTWEIVSGAFAPHQGQCAVGSASYINNVGALTPDNWLISPQIGIDGESSLSFWVCAQDEYWPEEHYVVRLSTTGTDPEDFTEDIYEETLSDGEWHQVIVDLGNYAGNACHIAFNHCDVTDQFWMKIDDVEIIGTRGEVISLGSGYHKATKTYDRSLLGYRIVRNGDTIVELQQDTEYWDLNMPVNYFIYNIYAVYVTGEADPYVIGPLCGSSGGSVPEYSTTLIGNSPNPFNPETKISYSLATPGKVELSIYNILGEKIRTLVNEVQDAGEHNRIWDGRDQNGKPVASGVYLNRLKANDTIQTRRMLLLK